MSSLLGAVPDDGADSSQPLRLHAARVLPEWVDYDGHAHESRYLQLFGDASDALLRHLGVDVELGSYFTVETHLLHLHEATAGERVHVTTQLLDHDEKRVHLFHELARTDDGLLLASAEQMLLHVDTRGDRHGAAMTVTCGFRSERRFVLCVVSRSRTRVWRRGAVG